MKYLADLMHHKINRTLDVHYVTMEVMHLAQKIGFNEVNVSFIGTSISELAMNIIKYGVRGYINAEQIDDVTRGVGIAIEVQDYGPGIADIKLALSDYSSSGTLGLGLQAVKRMMDEFEILSDSENGTLVRVKKWLN